MFRVLLFLASFDEVMKEDSTLLFQADTLNLSTVMKIVDFDAKMKTLQN